MIFKRKLESRFTVLPNETLTDERLSYGARGILAYLLSKPPNWEVRLQDLINGSPAGRTAVSRMIKELEEAGYMRRVQSRTEAGIFQGMITEVYDEPQSGFPLTGFPLTDNQPLISKEKKQRTKKNSKDVTPLTPQAAKFDPSQCIPESLKQPEFIAAWHDWLQHRKEIRKRMTPKATEGQLKTLEAIGTRRAVAAIHNSIANGYQGIFEPKTAATTANQPKETTKARLARIRAQEAIR